MKPPLSNRSRIPAIMPGRWRGGGWSKMAVCCCWAAPRLRCRAFYEVGQGQGYAADPFQRAKAQPLPEVEIVSMAREFQAGNRSMFSQCLRQTMEDSLSRGEQVILFLNRRGFSSAIVCRECGYTLTCEKCSIALTYHKEQNLAKCHYCDYMTPAPKHCPHCGSRFIRYMGSGTELVAEEVRRLWPWVTTDRMDLDTTQNKDAHNQILERFARGETQVLIGTQMVAKGLDFPNVTAVGVLAADLILNLPDYTAAERTFQLLTQVAGRAGRGDKLGRVVIQTYNPEHYSIVAAQQHDYLAFYEKRNPDAGADGVSAFLLSGAAFGIGFSACRIAGGAAGHGCSAGAALSGGGIVGAVGSACFDCAPPASVSCDSKGRIFRFIAEAAEYGQKLMNLSRKSKTLRILIDVEPLSVL